MFRYRGPYEALEGADKMTEVLACEDCKPSEVHLHASGTRMHTCLSVSCCCECGSCTGTGCLDVVSLLLVFRREGFDLPPQFGSGDILFGEVPPCPSLFFLPKYSPSLYRHDAFVVLGIGYLRIYHFPGMHVRK